MKTSGVIALVFVVRIIGILSDSVTGALIVNVAVIRLGDIIKGVTMVTRSGGGVEVTVTGDDSLLVSPELGIVVASV